MTRATQVTRSHRIAAAAAIGAALLAAGLLAGCDSSESDGAEMPPTTLLLVDDNTIVESVIYNAAQLSAMTLSELEEVAAALRVDAAGKSRTQLIDSILEVQAPRLNIRRNGTSVI